MKKMGLCLALFALLLSLSGCAGVESALHGAGEKIQSNRVETPQNNGGDIDWSFVPVVREKAVSLFTEAFPEAKVRETGVACKNTKADRVIVMTSRPGRVAYEQVISVPHPRHTDPGALAAVATDITERLRAEVRRHAAA